MAAGAEHPHPQRLMEFVRKQGRELPEGGAAYIRRTAEWLKAEYPASAPKLLPELRRMWREAVSK